MAEAREVRFIQRGRGSVVNLASNGEVNMFEEEGLTLGIFWVGGLGVGVFTRPEEPEEGDDGHVGCVPVGVAMFGVVEVQGVEHGLEDGGVDRLDTRGRAVLFAEAGEESRE
jgi:hypothetical protein